LNNTTLTLEKKNSILMETTPMPIQEELKIMIMMDLNKMDGFSGLVHSKVMNT
jgi:hypothetical protein